LLVPVCSAMNLVQIDYHEDATSVALIVTNDDFWLWFTTGAERRMRPQLISRAQIRHAIGGGFSVAEATAYLETRMQVAGYELNRSAMEHGNIAAWEIVSG
jgi:hypothetical protein